MEAVVAHFKRVTEFVLRNWGYYENPQSEIRVLRKSVDNRKPSGFVIANKLQTCLLGYELVSRFLTLLLPYALAKRAVNSGMVANWSELTTLTRHSTGLQTPEHFPSTATDASHTVLNLSRCTNFWGYVPSIRIWWFYKDLSGILREAVLVMN
jgi:hypothetical protein